MNAVIGSVMFQATNKLAWISRFTLMGKAKSMFYNTQMIVSDVFYNIFYDTKYFVYLTNEKRKEKMEILFKGQRLSDGKWLYGNIQVPKPPFEKWFMWNNKLQTQVDGNTICQFTGLYDATTWQDLTEDQRDKWTLDGNMPSEWKGWKLFSDDIISDGTRTIRIYMTEGGFSIKSYYWCSDLTDLTPWDELILQALPDAQTRSWIEGSCKLVGNVHDKN